MGRIAILAVLLTAACTSSATGGEGGGWTTPVTQTTCAQWLDDMTSPQRLDMSRFLIGALDAKDQSDDFARTFVRSITEDCQPAPSLTIQDVAAALATIDTGDFN